MPLDLLMLLATESRIEMKTFDENLSALLWISPGNK